MSKQRTSGKAPAAIPAPRLGIVALATAIAVSACAAPPTRVPLSVPLASVGGSRPVTPRGLFVTGEFGDGVWGQEQERAELSGGSLGFALADRFELSATFYEPTRDEGVGATAAGVRAKLRLTDFLGGRGSMGFHVAGSWSGRENSVQDERASAWDLALPLTLYPAWLQTEERPRRWGLYAAPRAVFERFEDRRARQETEGGIVAVLLGAVGRWRYVSLVGELNIARTPGLSLGTQTFEGGWIALPMIRASLMLPLGS